MARPKKLSDSDLLQAAYDVASREGFDSFTLQQVARTAHVSPAALIKRFRSKDNLVYLARRHRWDSTLGRFEDGAAERVRGLHGIVQLVSSIAGSVDSKRLSEHGKAFRNDAANPRTKQNVASYFAATRATLKKLLDEAIADGEVIAMQDTALVASALEALIQGSIFQFSFLTESGIEGHLQRHVDTFLNPYRR